MWRAPGHRYAAGRHGDSPAANAKPEAVDEPEYGCDTERPQ